MGKPRLADLFCCAGGAGMGYARAGFEVVGFDLVERARYPFEFRRRDVLTITPEELREEFDAIHASPPCQAHSALKSMHNAREHADLVPQTRALLKASGLPWIMENVVGAPLRDPVILCGTMFGLGSGDAELRRHRLFETSWPVLFVPECRHVRPRVIGVYGGHGRDRRRTTNTQDFSVTQRAEAMGIDWMTGAELSQAIPPAYTEWLGRQLLAQVQQREAA